ncbi:MAG: TetR/AcrR family transcriptional regulator [Chloroflexota bacterium]
MEKPAYHHGNLKQVLLEEALKFIETDGIKALSLRKVAKQAGVSPGAPYHHFKNKDELIAGLAVRSLEKLDATSEAAAQGQISPQEKLKAVGKAYILYAVENPEQFRLVFSSEQSGSFLSQPPNEAPLFRVLYKVIEELEAIGLVSNVQVAAITAWGLVHGVATLLIDGPLQPMSTDLEQVNALVEEVTSGLIYVQAAPKR